jgi:hypothetical protein
MALFDPPKAGDYPKQWKDMSFEFKLMFFYHGCMMVLFITGCAFSLRQELVFTGVLLFVLTSLSLRHRRSAGWRWQGVKPMNLLLAAGGVALMGVFLYAATPQFPPSNPRFLPWFLAGFGIGTFNVLQALRVVHPSEAAFLADCREPGSQIEQELPTEPTDPQWHRVVRVTYGLLFFLVWLEFVAFFYYSGATFRDGSPIPTATQTDAVTEHGKTVYITHDQKILCDKLELFAFVGIPSVIVGGPLLHFLVGVKLYPNAPTLREFLARKSSGI